MHMCHIMHGGNAMSISHTFVTPECPHTARQANCWRDRTGFQGLIIVK